MKNRNINYRKKIPVLLIALVLGCFSISSMVKADDDDRTIVGLWNVHYFSGGTEVQTYDQWHSDGLEFEVNSIFPGAVCQGVFKQEDGIVKLHHVIWIFNATGVLNGHIDERQLNTVSRDGNSYHGTFAQKIFDLNGNLVGQATGTLRATRISVH
jgi:hypothetical protein